MAEKKNIFETINAVMEEIGAVGKNSRNEKQKYMYRGVDDVMNALNPAFIKHKLFMVPEVVSQKREERQTANEKNLIYSVLSVKYTFYAEDGSSIYTIVPGEGMDSGDKASNKAMSSAFKYACFQVFCIPTEEMKDPDGEIPEPVTPAPQFTPATAEQLHKINRFVDAYAEMCENANAVDIVNQLKKMYNFSGTSDISTELANKLIEQVETWYKKRKEADA